MAKENSKPAETTPAPALRETGTWSLVQLLVFTLIGALAATFLSSQFATQDTDPNTIDVSKVKILSFDPLILHITDFISASERAHLLKLGTPMLQASAIRSDSGQKIFSTARTSSTAFLPPTDAIVSRIASRAATFQGFLNPTDIEMQITAYSPNQEYKHHYDWYPSTRPRNRISTFFAILKSTCSDCGTEFPFFNISAREKWDHRWCGVVDCSKELLTTRNIEGSALLWVNLDTGLQGREDMLHAGLPAVGGEKVGLNIWADVRLDEVWERGMFGGWSRNWFDESYGKGAE